MGNWLLLGWIFVVPALLAKFVIGASWAQAGCAAALWYIGLFLALGGPSVRAAEGFGWTMILSMFFGWAAVPAIALVLRLAQLPDRWLA
ncbi:hypothetical protein [Sphingomonas humi]|uniref:DUF4175 domain-containing protein n=1 Tax=Sphingomonas humi TaxID=335630 RepID=A0ABP7RWE7_9SPHN